nr:protein translocase subunit SecDF [Bacteroidota bacterium]
MKSKGAVKFFAIALAIVCLFQLSFSFVSWLVERKAERVSNGDPVRKAAYLDSISHEDVYNLLLYKYSYVDVKERELNLGLDLRGGMHVTMQVALDKLLLELSNNHPDPNFRKAIALAKTQQVTSQKGYIDLFYENVKRLNPNTAIATYFRNTKN